MVETLEHTKEQENLAGAKAVAWTSVFDGEGRTQHQMDQRMLTAKQTGSISSEQYAEYIQSQNEMIALMLDKGDGTQYESLVEARTALQAGEHPNADVQTKFNDVTEYMVDVKTDYAKKGSFAAGAVHELVQITNTSAEEAAVGNGGTSGSRKGYTGDDVVSLLMPYAINEVVTEDRTAVIETRTERLNALTSRRDADTNQANDYNAPTSTTRDELSFIAAGMAAADPEVNYEDVKTAILDGLPGNITGAQRASIELDLELGQFYHEQWQAGEIEIARLMSENPDLTRAEATATVAETNEFHGQVESAEAIVRVTFGQGQRIDGEVTAGMMATGVAQTYTSGTGLPDVSTDAGKKLNDSLIAYADAERANAAHQADVSVADVTASLPADTPATAAGTDTAAADTAAADTAAGETDTEEMSRADAIKAMMERGQEMMSAGNNMGMILLLAAALMDGNSSLTKEEAIEKAEEQTGIDYVDPEAPAVDTPAAEQPAVHTSNPISFDAEGNEAILNSDGRVTVIDANGDGISMVGDQAVRNHNGPITVEMQSLEAQIAAAGLNTEIRLTEDMNLGGDVQASNSPDISVADNSRTV